MVQRFELQLFIDDQINIKNLKFKFCMTSSNTVELQKRQTMFRLEATIFEK